MVAQNDNKDDEGEANPKIIHERSIRSLSRWPVCGGSIEDANR
jgi:hypothetical protein